ncbi:MAG: TAXI family TRAP transporter solute-binding subunit [Leptolyngbyaceae cyanobacterium SL_5_14]|nr:TAXI family TRAP transporter solute-binding subunit [Leptolyngbyaceae cyanobacterium SL_5_14]
MGQVDFSSHLGRLECQFGAGDRWGVVARTRVHRLTLAAGDVNGESYILSKAIEQVVETYHSNIEIEVQATGGTSDNLSRLEEGEAQLATAQADVAAGPSARTIAVLYQDLFQLVVKENSGIEEFVQLRGTRIGLPQEGGQFRSFLEVADHYGLGREDFEFLGENDQAASQAFQQNQVIAVFRVRAPGNQAILNLVQGYNGRILPIGQAEAMRIKHPAFEPAVIPQGAYKGSPPPMPTEDLPTIAVDRTLLVSDRVNRQVVQDITATINERRQEIAEAIPETSAEVKPLVASIDRPTTTGGTGVPLHPGAIAFYERDEPSFVQEYADFLALLLTITLLLGSWVIQLKSWIERGKKEVADNYVTSALEAMKEDSGDLDEKQKQLDQTFAQAADALIAERISQESFRTFNEAYKTAREAIDRRKQVAQQSQREISDGYIGDLLALMQDNQRSRDVIQKDLDRTFRKASTALVEGKISQESFRTFVEAYNATRVAIAHKTFSQQQTSSPATIAPETVMPGTIAPRTIIPQEP